MLNIRLLTRAKLKEGMRGKATLEYGDAEFPVTLRINTAPPEGPYVELEHETRDWRDERTVTYQVRLAWTVPPYGGRRWWFVCPRSHRWVAKLYLPNGGHYFWSRKAYGLGYGVQRETKLDRRMRKARKLSYALGGDGDIDAPPEKPKWMRWATYERKIAAFEEASIEANHLFGLHCAPLLRRLGYTD
jgi:hypothetical protein